MDANSSSAHTMQRDAVQMMRAKLSWNVSNLVRPVMLTATTITKMAVSMISSPIMPMSVFIMPSIVMIPITTVTITQMIFISVAC